MLVLGLIASATAGCEPGPALEQQTAALTGRQTVADRQLSQRRYDTRDEVLLLQAGASVLQDLGFQIDQTSPGSGMLLASKDRGAIESGQVAGQMLLALLAAASKTRYDPTYDRDQTIRVSLTTRPAPDQRAILVRVKFQRNVRTNRGTTSQLETIEDARIYQEFFDKLSQATFLQAQDI